MCYSYNSRCKEESCRCVWSHSSFSITLSVLDLMADLLPRFSWEATSPESLGLSTWPWYKGPKGCLHREAGKDAGPSNQHSCKDRSVDRGHHRDRSFFSDLGFIPPRSFLLSSKQAQSGTGQKSSLKNPHCFIHFSVQGFRRTCANASL